MRRWLNRASRGKVNGIPLLETLNSSFKPYPPPSLGPVGKLVSTVTALGAIFIFHIWYIFFLGMLDISYNTSLTDVLPNEPGGGEVVHVPSREGGVGGSRRYCR